MKRFSRILAMILCIACMMSMSSCVLFGRVVGVVSDMIEEITTEEIGTPVEPDALTDVLIYNLKRSDQTRFSELLAACETLVLAGTDVPAIEQAIEEMEAQYNRIATQAQIAYVLYCCDMSDEKWSEAQLFASAMQGDAYSEYMTFCQKVDQSSSPYRESFFSDWSESELRSMRNYTEEINRLSTANDALLADYHELDLETPADVAAIEQIYLEMVENYQAQAAILGYENYYDYAEKEIYLRDATAAEREAFRTAVAEEIIPLFEALLAEFQRQYAKLSYGDQFRLSNFITLPYDRLGTDYVANYIATYPTEVQSLMGGMLESDRSIFATASNSLSGAYTTYFYDGEFPFCYFGPDYSSCLTVLHEMGHFYAGSYTALSSISVDLSEVHSQTNEFLFLRYLQGEVSQLYFEVLELYCVLDVLSTIILATVIDDFEEYVYSNYDAIVSQSRALDDVMDEICAAYGGAEWLATYVGDMNLYWKYVVLDSAVYYLSYALSATAALSIYAISEEDVTAAREIYLTLCEAPDDSLTFREQLADAGLLDPYAASTLSMLRESFS